MISSLWVMTGQLHVSCCQPMGEQECCTLTNHREAWYMSAVVSNQEECDAINYTINNLYIHKASPWLASSLPRTLCNVNSPEYHVRPRIVIMFDLHMYNVWTQGILCRINFWRKLSVRQKINSFFTLIFMLPLSSKEKFGFSL